MKIFALCLVLLGFFFIYTNQNHQTVEGSLYFKLIDPFTIALSAIDSAKADEMLKVDQTKLREDERLLSNWYAFLINNKLHQKKAVRIRKENGAIELLFVKPSEYQKLAGYHLDSLLENKKLVQIKAEVTELAYDTLRVLDCEQSITVKEMPGTTYWKK